MSGSQLVLLGGASAVAANYIEDVFSTWIYNGNGSTQTITNGINLSEKGGMLWCKIRNVSDAHALFDTARGFPNYLVSNATIAQNGYGAPNSTDMVATTSGFSMNNISSASNSWNQSGNNYVSWTFRKQPKFFDVVTWTGNGSDPRTISHNLGSVPGCIMVKATNVAGTNWIVYHNSLTNPDLGGIYLNASNAEVNFDAPGWNVTSTTFTARASASLNDNNTTYVAYLFASNDGGFGTDGLQNVITCGSYVGNNSTTGPIIDLGYEPQWVLIKRRTSTGDWFVFDNMRSFCNTTQVNRPLNPNLTNAEPLVNAANDVSPLSNGFQIKTTSSNFNFLNNTYIYIAIRRGPMKTPTSGTSVFSPFYSSDAQGTQLTTNFPVDMQLGKWSGAASPYTVDRLRQFSSYPNAGGALYLETPATGSESSDPGYSLGWNNTGVLVPASWAGLLTSYCNFRRAPNVFDMVSYTGNGSARTIKHNLGVAPEMMVIKTRTGNVGWATYCAYVTAPATSYVMYWSDDAGINTVNAPWNGTAPTSTVFSIGTQSSVNSNGGIYIAYLFATLAGVSKVGSYTGNGSSQTINCGFTTGARFILIKRYDGVGGWYCYDSARGIVAGNDPQYRLELSSAIASYDAVDADNSGFIVNNDATNFPINVNNAKYIFLAIA